MKLNHYLKEYSFIEKKKLAILASGLDYSSKLELVKKIKIKNLPERIAHIMSIKAFINPLSNRKKIKVILNSNSFELTSSHPIDKYPELVQKNSRKNKIKEFKDLAKINDTLIQKEKTQPFNYSGWEVFTKIDGLSFKIDEDSYSFYIPKHRADFISAAEELKTCVAGYAENHLVNYFKFFLKKNGEFFSSVQHHPTIRNGHEGILTFYASHNRKPALPIQILATKILRPYFKDWDKFNKPSDSRRPVTKTIVYSKNPKKIYSIDVLDLIQNNEADPKVFYYSSVFSNAKKYSETVYKNYQDKWYEIITDTEKNITIYELGLSHQLIKDLEVKKILLELTETQTN